MRSGWCGCLLLFVVLSACGGDDQSEPNRADAAAEPPVQPVDPEKRLTELSSDETARVCGALSDRFDDLLSSKQYLELSCTQQAWPVSFDFSNITGELMGSPTRCKELLSMCLDKGGALGDFTPTKSLGADLVDRMRCNKPAAGLDLDACAATVGDFEACSKAAASELGSRLAHATCDALGHADMLQGASPQVDIAQLTECEGLLERCPIFMLDTQPDGKAPIDAE